MAVIGLRQLSRETSRVIQDFEESGEPVIVTREGRPIGALMPLSETQLQDLVLATAPEFRPRREERGREGFQQLRSLGEAAAERGIDLPSASPQHEASAIEDPGFEELRELATESELQPFSVILSQPLAGEVLKAANTEIGEVSREALVASGTKEFQEGELREVTSATAGLYGRLFRHYLPRALCQAEAPESVLKASHSAGKALRAMNKSIIEVPDFSLHAYTAAIRAVEVAWESGMEDEEERDIAANLAEPAS